MKPKIRPSSGFKKTGNSIVSHKEEAQTRNIRNKKELILVTDGQKGQGNGLWCVNTINTANTINNTEKVGHSNNSENIQTNNQRLNSPNEDLELEIERRKISQLKFQVNDLSAKLHSALSKCAEADYQANRLTSREQIFQETIEKKDSMMKDYEERIENYENTLINLNEALSNAKKEITRLQTENKSMNEKCSEFYEMYQNLKLDKERKESAMSSEISSLMLKLHTCNSEKESLVKMMRTHGTNENKEWTKKLEDKEHSIKHSENQMNRLINENADLKRKFANEEGLKTKLNEIIKKKKDKISRLKEEIKSYKEAIPSYTNEVKWNQELVLQRDHQIKVYKEKIKKLEEDLNKQIKENEKLKQKKQIVHKESLKEETCEVKAKPFLFGPETDDFNI